MRSPNRSPKRDRRSHRGDRRRSASHSPSRRRQRSPAQYDDRHEPRRRAAASRSRSPERRKRSPDDRGEGRIERRFDDIPESQRYGKPGNLEDTQARPVVKKEEPNYQVSGALAAEQNTFKGVVLKYSEPPEARKSKERYRLYVFKGKEQIDLLHIHRQSAYLLGRDRIVADIPIDHPSCSKQHAVLQYRQIVETDALGQVTRIVKPYIIDLESANGTFINGAQIPASRYVELKLGDTLKFGFSSREYVLMSEDMIEGDK